MVLAEEEGHLADGRIRQRSTYVKEVLVEGPTRRGRPLCGWKDRVKEYMCESIIYNAPWKLNSVVLVDDTV